MAYYKAAKECHPDTTSKSSRSHASSDVDAAERFRLVTEAYEFLQQQHG